MCSEYGRGKGRTNCQFWVLVECEEVGDEEKWSVAELHEKHNHPLGVGEERGRREGSASSSSDYERQSCSPPPPQLSLPPQPMGLMELASLQSAGAGTMAVEERGVESEEEALGGGAGLGEAEEEEQMEAAVQDDAAVERDTRGGSSGVVEEASTVSVFHFDFAQAPKVEESASAHASGNAVRPETKPNIKQEIEVIDLCSEDSAQEVVMESRSRISLESRRRTREESIEEGDDNLPAKLLRTMLVSRHIPPPVRRRSSSEVHHSSTPQPQSPPSHSVASTSSRQTQRLPTPSTSRASGTPLSRLRSPLVIAPPPPTAPPLPIPTPPPHSTSHPFLPSLSALLHHLSPSLSPYAPLLIASGLTSSSSLLNLLGMEPEYLGAYVEELRKGVGGIKGMPTFQRRALKAGVARGWAAMLEEEEGEG